jgi:hypothetical protein
MRDNNKQTINVVNIFKNPLQIQKDLMRIIVKTELENHDSPLVIAHNYSIKEFFNKELLNFLENENENESTIFFFECQSEKELTEIFKENHFSLELDKSEEDKFVLITSTLFSTIRYSKEN